MVVSPRSGGDSGGSCRPHPSNLPALWPKYAVALRTAMLATVANSASTNPRVAAGAGLTTRWPVLASSVRVAKSGRIAVDRLGTIRNPNATAAPKHTQG